MKKYRLGATRRAVNLLIKALAVTGMGSAHYVLLTVRGRTTGRLYTTPVRPIEHDGQCWLVAPYGAVSWVRNARAEGQVTLRRGRRRRTGKVIECETEESAPILREYVQAVPVTRPFFDAAPGDPVDRFAEEATQHPVFRFIENPKD
jgi:deazaflavin-dependent oxidoreductase (nitroreductase family)